MLFSGTRRMLSSAVGLPKTSFIATTWLPSLKKKNEDGLLMRTPMSSLEAKRLRTSSPEIRGLDLYGHACAELIINLEERGTPKGLVNVVRAIADQHGYNPDKLQLVRGYVSWYPTEDHGREQTIAELQKLVDFDLKLEKDSGELADLKRGLMKVFLGNIYKAENGDPASDIRGYGEPDPSRVFEFDKIDFLSIFVACAQMMECDFKDGELLMSRIRPEGMYSGLDMFETCKKSMGYESSKEDFMPKPEHVCTTAVLRLLEAGVGKKNYIDSMRDVILESPDLSHGFPISEFTHAICQKLHSAMNKQYINENKKSVFSR